MSARIAKDMRATSQYMVNSYCLSE